MVWPAGASALVTGAASGIGLGITLLGPRVHGEIARAFADFDGRQGRDATADIMVNGTTPIAW